MDCPIFFSITTFLKNVDYLSLLGIAAAFFIYYWQRKREAKENYELLHFLVLEQGARMEEFGKLLDKKISLLSEDNNINLVLPLQDQLNPNILDRVDLPAAIRYMRSNVKKRNALYAIFNSFNTYKTIDHVINKVNKSSHEILKLYNQLQRTFKELEAHLKLEKTNDTTVLKARDYVIDQCKELPVYNALQLQETNLTIGNVLPVLSPLILINPQSIISAKCLEICELSSMIERIKKHAIDYDYKYLKDSCIHGVNIISKFESIAL